MSRTLLLGLFAAFISLAVGEADAGYEAAAEPATVHISTTACGEEAAEEVIPLLKTIAIHANPKNKYFVHVFMNNHTEFPLIKARLLWGLPLFLLILCLISPPACPPALLSPPLCVHRLQTQSGIGYFRAQRPRRQPQCSRARAGPECRSAHINKQGAACRSS